MLTRRNLLINAAGLAGLATFSPLNELFGEGDKKFRVAACDWSLGKSADIGAFEVAKEIGLEGLMINMGAESDQLRLREKAVQQAIPGCLRENRHKALEHRHCGIE
jgi:hypothetical protein